MFFLFAGGMSDTRHRHRYTQRHAREGMVAIDHHMLWVNICDGVDLVGGRILTAAGWQRMAFNGHAFFDFSREQGSGL